MFKNLVLTVKGWFREKGNEHTDLRLAGKEHIHNINKSIDEVRAQHNAIGRRGIILENKIKEKTVEVAKFLDAVKHHNAAGDMALRDKAYAEYTKAQNELDELTAEKEDVLQQAEAIKDEIKNLERDTNAAKNELGKAATRQVIGAAMTNVEDIHDDLKRGPLSEAIEHHDEKAAGAEFRRRMRKEDDNSDVLAYQQQNNVLSLDSILADEPAKTE